MLDFGRKIAYHLGRWMKIFFWKLFAKKLLQMRNTLKNGKKIQPKHHLYYI